ncbi:hypothetical protein J5N97_011070 [Dioscorea zingiberensis]|uniref:Uncharacterized protein n=1 Tax=Dioscorea zingiberensis TaxID=325984 RepID=A0A9D5HN00_9LILI|nr:hypothetical protein J5N97_011070 [Dioscorea zingiberensis]
MFGRCFRGCRKDTRREEKEEVLEKSGMALPGDNVPLEPLISKALWSMGIAGSALYCCLPLIPPHMKAGLSRDIGLFRRRGQTPEIFKYILNNHPSAGTAEAFIVTVLRLLGFGQFGSDIDQSRLSWNGRVFAFMLAENCFTRDLLNKYRSIDWAAGVPPLPEMGPGWVAFMADDQWRQPLADWIKRFASIAHSRVFPSEPYSEIEAKVNFFLVSFINDMLEYQFELWQLLRPID